MDLAILCLALGLTHRKTHRKPHSTQILTRKLTANRTTLLDLTACLAGTLTGFSQKKTLWLLSSHSRDTKEDLPSNAKTKLLH